ncbi:MAG: alanine--glyoxylate aminotransferase family protein [Candidatus Lokiarchaeota archaeon]|nr:alanine--glyoxylate aminotransferase family protein [Candidatus Lokiarchaeota archaeon]
MEINKNPLLMLPGPVAIHHRVYEIMSKPIIGHRTQEFVEILDDTIQKFKNLLKTKNFVALITGSSTSAMDAAVCNCIEPGVKVLNIIQGKFSERWMDITRGYGCISVPLELEWGKGLRIEQISEALEKDDSIKFVTVVHNETSTGVLNNIKDLAALCKKLDKYLLVDGVTSVGGDDIYPDEWNLDVLVTGSQKCLGIPPGLAMICVSPRAWELIEKRKCKYSHYLDLLKYKKDPQPFTPAITLVRALNESLKIIEEEGIENRFKRHKLAARACREGIKALGLELFAEEGYYSNTVTAIKVPDNLTSKSIIEEMRKNGVIITGGQGKIKGKIFRIAHMNMVGKDEILTTLSILELSLKNLGFPVKTGNAIEIATEIFK